LKVLQIKFTPHNVVTVLKRFGFMEVRRRGSPDHLET